MISRNLTGIYPARVSYDPCYPLFDGDIYDSSSDEPYTKLLYDGPIWQA